MKPTSFQFKPIKPVDWAISCLISVMVVVLLLQTMNVGFPRDEGFYFRFSAIYQSWFSDIWNDEEGALEQERIDEVWKNNREHPPLAKALFGLSWANLTEKRRPVQRAERSRKKGTRDWVHVTGLRRGEGFKEDVDILLLKPLKPEDSEKPTIERVFARAKIDAVRNGRVRARIVDGELSYKSFREVCGGRYGPKDAWTGCEAVVEADLGKLEETSGFRLPTVIWFALLLGSLYLFGVATMGRWAALFAACSLVLVPRHFYHAHLATFDVPVMTMIFWLVVSFWLSLRSRRWAVVCGVLFGLALLTKLNAFFIPVVLGGWWLSHARLEPDPERPLRVGPVHLPAFPLAFWTMPLLGIPLFVALWPRLWFDGWSRFLEYVRFHMHHDHYMQNYFGEVLSYPPFPISFPFGMTLFTFPAVTLLLGLIGGALMLRKGLHRGWRERRVFSMGEWLGIHCLFPIVLIALPSTPVFGGVKHWMTGMPFLCLLAGFGFEALRQGLLGGMRERLSQTLTVGLLVLCLAPGAMATMRIHPEGTAYYNALIGGLPGAASASMQRQFWGGQTRQGLDYLNEHVPRGGKVYFHKSPRGCWDLYRKEGLLRSDIQHVADLHNFNKIEEDIRKTSHAVYHHQKSHDDYELAIWRAYGTEIPVFQMAVDGVPLLSIYENPKQKEKLEKRLELRKKVRKGAVPRPGKSQTRGLMDSRKPAFAH